MVNLTISIPDGFLKEQERDGFIVSSLRKEIWAIELDLLMQLDKVCKENNLHYCVGAGTLLGAIRHHGFIPWDDDIDVYMLRHDYDKLMELAKEFQYPYFLQNTYTDSNEISWFSRLRNAETTGATKRELYIDICKGIFIDIFPLDGICDNKTEDKKQEKKNELLKRICRLYNVTRRKYPDKRGNTSIKKRILKKVLKLVLSCPKLLFRTYDNNLKKYSSNSTKIWGNRTLVFECPKSRRPLKDYQECVMMPFEFIEVPVPKAYDSMLRQQYGDYMKIPENKGSDMHGELVISTDYAYNDPRRIQEK